MGHRGTKLETQSHAQLYVFQSKVASLCWFSNYEVVILGFPMADQ